MSSSAIRRLNDNEPRNANLRSLVNKHNSSKNNRVPPFAKVSNGVTFVGKIQLLAKKDAANVDALDDKTHVESR